MGNSTSSSAKDAAAGGGDSSGLLSPADLKRLGDRYPFSDDELRRLARCHRLVTSASSTGESLIAAATRSAVEVPSLSSSIVQPKEETTKRRADRMAAAERDILPPGFGAKLESAAFGIVDDGAAPTTTTLEDFLEGAAGSSGRRGPRPALSALFKCCGARSGGVVRADAGTVLDLAHRLALASSFLADDAGTGGAEGYRPRGQEEGGSSSSEALALASSLIQHAKKTAGGFGGGGFGYAPGPATTNTQADNANDDDNSVTLESFLEWSDTTAPQLAACLPTFLHGLFFPDRPYPPTRAPFVLPQLDQPSAIFGDDLSVRGHGLLFALACASPALGGPWHRLYNSTTDGLSFNRMLLSLIGYGGPTLLIIREKGSGGGGEGGGGIFGAYTSTPWNTASAPSYHGDSDCFLFRLTPSLNVYRAHGGSERNYMYLNPESRSKGYDGLPHGLGFGGDASETGQPRLFLSETFDGCKASSFDLTFDEGSLLPPPDGGASSSSPRMDFDIADLEVWGVGGSNVIVEGALHARLERRKADLKIRNKMLKAKGELLEDLQGGVMAVENKNFKHRDEMRGRDGVCAADVVDEE